MAKHPTNPTGYAIATPASSPDCFGPLFGTPASPPASAPVNQQSTINTPLPRSVDVAGRVASERYMRILRSIDISGPSTLFELCGRFNVTPNQISGRITELKRNGLLIPIGQKPHPVSGAACDILHLTDQGRKALKEGKPL